jgi:hypothetical protein
MGCTHGMPCVATSFHDTRSTASKPASKLTGLPQLTPLSFLHSFFLRLAPAETVTRHRRPAKRASLGGLGMCAMVHLKMPGLDNWPQRRRLSALDGMQPSWGQLDHRWSTCLLCAWSRPTRDMQGRTELGSKLLATIVLTLISSGER